LHYKQFTHLFSSVLSVVLEGYFFNTHHGRNMLGLTLTTTSLPPPVWTHIRFCLFKLWFRSSSL